MTVAIVDTNLQPHCPRIQSTNRKNQLQGEIKGGEIYNSVLHNASSNLYPINLLSLLKSKLNVYPMRGITKSPPLNLLTTTHVQTAGRKIRILQTNMNKICAWETITCKSYSLILQQILLEHIKFMMVFLSFWKYIIPNFTLVKLQKFVPLGTAKWWPQWT